MSDSIDGAALIAATHIVLHENQRSGDELIVWAAQTAVKLMKAYREATLSATSAADYSDLMDKKPRGAK